MANRHQSIGIKQAIRLEWMQKAVNLLLAGLSVHEVRPELHQYFIGLHEEEGVERSRNTRTFLVNNLMRIWVDPDNDVIAFRDASLNCLRNGTEQPLPIHWAMISAAYPFWFNVARQTGRLLSLQDRVTQMQIINRMKEQYGDRQTISRYAKYVIRSFVAWGVLVDTETKGCYSKTPPNRIERSDVGALVYESALYAEQSPTLAISLIQNNPSFFPFEIKSLSGSQIAQLTNRIDLSRYGLDDELLVLKGRKVPQ